MTFKSSSFVCIEELERAVELNRPLVPCDILGALNILLSHKVFCFINTLWHRVILIEIENLTHVNRVLVSDAHRLKVVRHEVRMRNLFNLILPHEFEIS